MSIPTTITPLGQVDPIKLLRDLVAGLQNWTPSPGDYLEALRAAELYLSRLDTHEDLLASVLSAIESCGCDLKVRDGGGHRDGCPTPDLQRYLELSVGRV